jgi:hypothetical protein
VKWKLSPQHPPIGIKRAGDLALGVLAKAEKYQGKEPKGTCHKQRVVEGEDKKMKRLNC